MDLGFEFWITNSSYSLRLPIIPENYEMTISKQLETVRMTSTGDRVIKGPTAPLSLEMTSFFTTHDYYFAYPATVSVSITHDYVDIIKGMMEDTVRVIITNIYNTVINKEFFISDFSYYENNESNGDIFFTIKFQEYQAMKVTSTTSSIAETVRAVTETVSTPTTYTVVKNDSLSSISRAMYGTTSSWEKIYNANLSVIGSNANLIYPGQVLTIPD